MLELLGREASHKGLVNDGMEPPDERQALSLDLRVHPEVGHVVDIADPGRTVITPLITKLVMD